MYFATECVQNEDILVMKRLNLYVILPTSLEMSIVLNEPDIQRDRTCIVRKSSRLPQVLLTEEIMHVQNEMLSKYSDNLLLFSFQVMKIKFIFSSIEMK